MTQHLQHLNSNQREAVLHGEGPLLVLAGAGSGKTSTMAYRIAHLVAARHIKAGSILGLSFTNKAAKELKERVVKLVTKTSGRKASHGLTITTFHSLCARLLRNHAEALGFQKNFTILDQHDQKDVLRSVLRNIKIDERRFDPDVILFEIGQAKNRFLKPEQAELHFLESKRMSSDYGIAAASSYGKYQEQLKVLNAMDFDDLLYHAVRLLEEHPEIRKHYNWHFRHILVDEYQDTNPAQFRLLRLLTEDHQNICVVGDDDQSIYSWRGADPTHILEFARHYPSARTITLDQNYRSTNTILDAANQVIQNNRQRHPKKLWSDRGTGEPISEFVLEDDRDEGEFVAEEIARRAKEPARPWKDFAILYRSNAQSRIFEEALRRHQIPYKMVGGMSFLDRKEVKDILSYWRLIINPKDDASLRRVLNWPTRGIGKGSVESLGTHAFTHDLSLFEAMSAAPTLAPRSAQAIASFQAMIRDLRQRLETSSPDPVALASWGRATLEVIGAKRAVEEENDDPAQVARKWESIEELVHSLGQTTPEVADPLTPEPVAVTSVDILREFLNRMTLEAQDQEDKDKDRKDEKRDEVTLLTLHGAKGLEYPVVFLVGTEEGYLPHKRTIEEATDFGEERRLCYVGITRARDHLILTRAKKRIRYGKPVPRLRSRFLQEISESLIIRQDKSFGPDENSTEKEREAHEERVKGFLSNIRASILKG